LAATPAGPP